MDKRNPYLRRHDIEHAPIAVTEDDAAQQMVAHRYLMDSAVEQVAEASANDAAPAPAPSMRATLRREARLAAVAAGAVSASQPLAGATRPIPGPRASTLPARNPRRLIAGGVSVLLLAGLLAWGIVILRDPHTLPLKSVSVGGAFTKVSSTTLQQAIADVASGGFLYVDVDRIRAAAQRVPWVHRVNVRRVWPDTLRVSITEQTAVARWSDLGLLNSAGEIFAAQPASYPAGLPELRGPQGTQTTVLAQYRLMSTALAPLNLHVARLELDARRTWHMRLDNGIELMLGRSENYARLLRFVRVYRSVLAAQAANIARVDLRYSNGLAVRLKTVASDK